MTASARTETRGNARKKKGKETPRAAERQNVDVPLFIVKESREQEREREREEKKEIEKERERESVKRDRRKRG